MVITFTAILFGLAAVIFPLRQNKFFLLSSALVIGAAYFIEHNYFRTSIFSHKTILLFLVFHLVAINFSTFIAYGADKRAAQRGQWRVSERDLHMLEFLGGWLGAFLGQRFFHHKTTKKSYQATYKFMIIMEFAAIWVILKYLHLL